MIAFKQFSTAQLRWRDNSTLEPLNKEALINPSGALSLTHVTGLHFSHSALLGTKNSSTIIDLSSDKFIKTFDDKPYRNPTWTADGDLIIWDYNNTGYHVEINGDQIGDPVEIFQGVAGAYHAISPDGQKIVFTMNYHIWVCNIDGSELRQITAPASGYETYPEWSPDGQYILLKLYDFGDSFGSLWIVSADAENLIVGYHSEGSMPIRSADGGHFRSVYGPVTWLP